MVTGLLDTSSENGSEGLGIHFMLTMPFFQKKTTALAIKTNNC